MTIVILQRRNQSDYLSCRWWQGWRETTGLQGAPPLLLLGRRWAGLGVGVSWFVAVAQEVGLRGGLPVTPVPDEGAVSDVRTPTSHPRPPVSLQVARLSLGSTWELWSSRTASEVSERCFTQAQDPDLLETIVAQQKALFRRREWACFTPRLDSVTFRPEYSQLLASNHPVTFCNLCFKNLGSLTGYHTVSKTLQCLAFCESLQVSFF